MSGEDRDVPRDAGRRTAFTGPTDEDAGDVGDGGGYSGQEYDGAGQAAWRDRQAEHAIPASGVAYGSGASAGGGDADEEYDRGTPGGGEPDGSV